MTFAPGQSGNPKGRPPGARHHHTQVVIDQIKATGNKDPLVVLSELSTTSQDESIRATASSMLAPYMHGKLGSIPPPRYFENPVTVPDFTTVEDAERFLASIPQLLGNQQIDSQSAMELSTLTRNWLSAKYERDEMRIKMANANADSTPQVIEIRGGLPALPGTNITMPDLNNGQRVNDSTLPLGPPDNGPCEPSSDTPMVSDRTAIESITNDSEDPPPSNETE